MKLRKPTIANIAFIVIIALLIWPKTRQPIQVFLHKGLALFSPSKIQEENRKRISDYNWELQSLDGLRYDFSKAKEKVVLINFWATWCPPCIAEMPAIQELYNDYDDKIDFLLVSDEKEEIVLKFLNKHDYSFKIHRPLSVIPEALKTKSIPRTFIISKAGEIVVDKTGAANWNSDKIRNIIDELIAK